MNITYEKEKKGSLEWLTFDLLKPFREVKHAVFLRGSGFDLGDGGRRENLAIALDTLGLKKGVTLTQVHGDSLLIVEQEKEPLTCKGKGDGLITNVPSIGLAIRHADCQAAIFYDPVQRVLANIHCGWRGSVSNIYRKTIETMTERFHTNPADLRVCIGPSLSPNAAEFKQYQKELPLSFHRYQTKPYHFDFWTISLDQLLKAGVSKKQIEIAKICTYDSPYSCFSHRREGKEAGRHATIAALV